MDRFGRPMSVRPETMNVLKQLPDISFLSARTLLFSPDERHMVQDLGAMINRKMPGWVTSVWMWVWKGYQHIQQDIQTGYVHHRSYTDRQNQNPLTPTTFQTCVQAKFYTRLNQTSLYFYYPSNLCSGHLSNCLSYWEKLMFHFFKFTFLQMEFYI